MLTLTTMTTEQARILHMLVNRARDPTLGGRLIGSSQAGYPVWYLECDRASLARFVGLEPSDFVGRKQLELNLEALTHIRIVSREDTRDSDCGPALTASKCYRDPEGLDWIGFNFELPCLLSEIDWSGLVADRNA